MYPVSDRFKAAMRDHHKRVSRAVILDQGRPVIELPVSAGSVRIDPGASVRRQASFTILARPDLIPQHAADYLFPRVNEVLLKSGIEFSPATRTAPADEELVPLGVFRIMKPDSTEDNDGNITISCDGYDRAMKVSDAKLLFPYVINKGTNYVTAIRSLIAAVTGETVFNFVNLPYATPQIVLNTGADPWAEAQKMASSIGCELFYDVNGICTLRLQPDPSTSPVVWEYHEGEDNMAINMKKTIDGSYGYNTVVVRGATSTGGEDGPVIAIAYDSNPASPTYVGSPPGSSDYGIVTYFATSPYVATSPQAQAYADAKLRSVLGAGEVVSFDSLVNPAQDSGDVISIIRSTMKVNGLYVADSMTVPLDATTNFSVETRKRQVL